MHETGNASCSHQRYSKCRSDSNGSLFWFSIPSLITAQRDIPEKLWVCKVLIHALLLLSRLMKSVLPFDPGKLVPPVVSGNDSAVGRTPWAWLETVWAPILISSFWDSVQPVLFHPLHGVDQMALYIGSSFQEGYLASSSSWLPDTKLLSWDLMKLGSQMMLMSWYWVTQMIDIHKSPTKKKVWSSHPPPPAW